MTPYYKDESVTLYHGSCDDVLPLLPSSSVDTVLTSPPYNLGEGMEDKGGFRVAHVGSLWAGSNLGDGYENHDDAMPYPKYVAWQQNVLRECWRITSGAIYYNHKPRIVKGALRTPLALVGELPVRQIVIWNRGSGFNFMFGAYVPRHEWIVILAKPEWTLKSKGASGVGDVWDIPPATRNEHPAPFPLELAHRVIETSDARVLLDPFAGSGTTLVAAKMMKRKAIGIEKSERYCEMAALRLTGKKLIDDGAAFGLFAENGGLPMT